MNVDGKEVTRLEGAQTSGFVGHAMTVMTWKQEGMHMSMWRLYDIIDSGRS